MNLLGRVLIMTVCAFTAYALPNIGNIGATNDIMLKTMIAKLQSALVNPLAANNTQDACFVAYSKHLNEISSQTVNETEKCNSVAQQAIANYTIRTNNTANTINALSKDLQSRLANCSAKNSSAAVFDCYVETFDTNLENLYSLTVQSQVAANDLSGFAYAIDYERQACINSVLITNKINTTIASNNLQVCLTNSTIGGGSNSTVSGNKTVLY